MAFKSVPVSCVIVLVLCMHQVLGLRVAEQKCQEYIKTIASLNPVPVERTNQFKTVVNGVPAKEAEFPHQIRVGQWAYEDYDDPGWIIRCSGALISERYVLMSAHCFWSMADNYVSLGRHDYRHNSSLPEVRIKRTKEENLILHPGYNTETKNSYNNIGLLRLEEPVNFTSYIYPACLWTDESPQQPDSFIAAGFTMGKFVNNTDDTYLAKLLLNVVPTEECGKEYANSTYYQNGMTEEHLCMQSPVEWNSTCDGDAGAILQRLEKGSTTVYRVYGVEGNGIDCEENHLKFTYTKVLNYLDWIEQIVWGTE